MGEPVLEVAQRHTSGGSETMRRSPSTTSVSREKAFMLSFVRALASARDITFASLTPPRAAELRFE